MGDFDISPPSLDPTTTKAVTMSTEIMIITVVVLCFVIAFCFFVHMYAKCYWITYAEDPNVVSWRRRIARRRPQPSAVATHHRGLDSAALQSLPVVVYDPKNFKEGLECAVCLSEVSEGEKARLLPKCNHGFHVECIDMWFKSHVTCPLCRNSVVSDDSNSTSLNGEYDDALYASDSSIESDNDHNEDYDDEEEEESRVAEPAVFPTNVLVWGDETRVRSYAQTENDEASTSGVNRPRNGDELVIDIPPPSGSLSAPTTQDEAKTPVVSRLGSFRRWLSFGMRMGVTTPSPRGVGSSSCEVSQGQQV